ncbi:cytochrome P450 [Pseudovirgaria hyperparasitica]|uniref:Cytochrome P450 n=1 Tax=Pseudovirgaria hyperparasitica TaxID=470096 RepID=A0A6A6W2A2_9PEZI|nr:cytochrome P450 [Pseudovirgaria hyperparasitica]KAF2756144.1 cytochrome P450 [Pseudovirgaria hyperparasitica]
MFEYHHDSLISTFDVNISEAGLIPIVADASALLELGNVGTSKAWTVLFLFSLLYVFNLLKYSFEEKVNAPVVGHRHPLEPQWLVRLRFVRGSRSILHEGYSKFKESMFQIRRIGTDVLVISPKILEEIRSISRDKVNSVEPFIHDFVGEYVCGKLFLESDLQNRVLHQKLTPNLGRLVPVMKEELDWALVREMPNCQGNWVELDIVPKLARIVSHISARIFLGPADCRNEEWVETTTQYTENLFVTGFILRLVPKILRPLVAPLLPSFWGLKRNVSACRRIVGHIIQTRRDLEAQSGPGYQRPNDVLQWMMDAANTREAEVGNLCQRVLVLSLSSIHTTALTMSQALYDLCAHPEFLEPIRAEVVQVLQEDGGWEKKGTLGRLRRLDSLLKESQRFNPVFLLTFNRIYHKRMKLSDGTVIPPGTRVAVPSNEILNDPEHVPGDVGPELFDAFRYFKVRQQPENSNKYLFAMADGSNMAFGFGRFACPGRFYVSNEMKMVLAHLLLMYDLKFPEGQMRPENLTVDGDLYPDPRARLLIRKRTTFASDMDMLLK